MDKIIALRESSPQTSNQNEINESKLVEFIKTIPIWDFFKITQSKYLSFSKEEKTKLVNDYYLGMQQGKVRYFFILFKVEFNGLSKR